MNNLNIFAVTHLKVTSTIIDTINPLSSCTAVRYFNQMHLLLALSAILSTCTSSLQTYLHYFGFLEPCLLPAATCPLPAFLLHCWLFNPLFLPSLEPFFLCWISKQHTSSTVGMLHYLLPKQLTTELVAQISPTCTVGTSNTPSYIVGTYNTPPFFTRTLLYIAFYLLFCRGQVHPHQNRLFACPSSFLS